MEPSLIHSLIGNLGLSPDFSRHANNSPSAKSKSHQKNRNKKGVQIVININGVEANNQPIDHSHQQSSFRKGFHAVFLDNNQVYFGKLRWLAPQQLASLKEVYYLRDVNEAAVLNFDLVKLGSEIHSPEDEMHINTSHILFWEKLQDNGPIVTAILNYKRNQ